MRLGDEEIGCGVALRCAAEAASRGGSIMNALKERPDGH